MILQFVVGPLIVFATAWTAGLCWWLASRAVKSGVVRTQYGTFSLRAQPRAYRFCMALYLLCGIALSALAAALAFLIVGITAYLTLIATLAERMFA